MKKLILMVASLMIVSPINAENFNEIINSRSYTLKCMMHRKCKDGVKSLNDISDIASFYPDSNFNIVADEFHRMLTYFKKIGVEVFLGDKRYFPKKYRGIYSHRKNNIYLNEAYMSNPDGFMRTMRHEGWHVAQDCKKGMKNGRIGIIVSEKFIPKSYQKSAERLYADRPDEIPYERVAILASRVVGMTEAALESCVENEDKYINEYFKGIL